MPENSQKSQLLTFWHHICSVFFPIGVSKAGTGFCWAFPGEGNYEKDSFGRNGIGVAVLGEYVLRWSAAV